MIEVWRLAFSYMLSEEEGNKFKYQNKCWLKVLLSGPSQVYLPVRPTLPCPFRAAQFSALLYKEQGKQ